MADPDNIEAKIVSIDAKTTNLVSNTGTTASNVLSLTTEVAGLSNKVGVLTTEVTSGFQGVEARLTNLVAVGLAEISYLNGNIEQNKTILCWLEKIANLLCSQLRVQESIEVTVGEIAASTANLGAILALVHAREALEIQARHALEARMEACCPEEVEPPGPCFERCEDPKFELVELKPGSSDTKPNAAANTKKGGK